jgi:hypothetical protein
MSSLARGTSFLLVIVIVLVARASVFTIVRVDFSVVFGSQHVGPTMYPLVLVDVFLAWVSWAVLFFLGGMIHFFECLLLSFGVAPEVAPRWPWVSVGDPWSPDLGLLGILEHVVAGISQTLVTWHEHGASWIK